MKRTILNRNIKQNRPAAMMVSMCCAVGAILLTGLFVIKFSLSGSFDLNYPVIDGPCMTIASDNSDVVKNISEMLKRQDAAAHVILYDRCVTKGVTIADRNYPFAYVFSGDSLVIAENEVYVNNSVVDISPGETVLFNSEKEPYLVKGVISDPVNAAPDVMNTVLYVRLLA